MRRGGASGTLLRNTFIHIEGVGPVTESRLWSRGILTWEEFLDRHRRERASLSRWARLAPWIQRSREALQDGAVEFFAGLLPASEQWRLYREFRHSVAFLDIETTGLHRGSDQITVIGLLDGRSYRSFIRGSNLGDFPRAASRYKLLVTYNGAQFDIPFLRSSFRDFDPPGHLDLRFPLARLGYRGGLKSVEREVGIRRPAHLREMDGFEAVVLWHEYRRGRAGALERLLEYTEQDVRSLRPLAELVAERMPARVGLPPAARDRNE